MKKSYYISHFIFLIKAYLWTEMIYSRKFKKTVPNSIMVVSIANYLLKQNQLFNHEMCFVFKHRIKGNDLLKN